MRALMLEAPQSFLDERARLGLGVRDELWEGVLHMVPPPSLRHQRMGRQLLEALGPAAAANGLEPLYETGVFASDTSYRVPDLVFARPEHMSDRGIEGGGDLVIEILSTDDESREKLPFYASVGVSEVWLVDPGSRRFEVYVLRGESYHAALSDDAGRVRSPGLGVTLCTGTGPSLHIAGPHGETTI